MRTDSANDGGISSVAIASALAPAACAFVVAAHRLLQPQPEDHEDDASGSTNTKNGVAPARTVREQAAERTAPTNEPTAMPMRWKPKTSARFSIG